MSDHTPRNVWATGVYDLRHLSSAAADRVAQALYILGCRVFRRWERTKMLLETDAHETTVNALVRECERAGVQR